MAPRNEHSDNVVFLFKCIESTGAKIDFGKTGGAIGIKANAARMRYARLRKTVEGELDHPASGIAPSTPPKPRIKKSGPIERAKKASKKRKRQISDDNEEERDDSNDDGAKLFDTNVSDVEQARESEYAESLKPYTRGVKIDFTNLFADAESLDDSGAEEDPSNFSNNSTASTLLKSQVKAKASPRKLNKDTETPSPSEKSTDQVSVLPAWEDEEYRMGNDSFTNLTPPQSAKKTTMAIAQMDGDIDDDDVRADFLSLASGHKISESMFKRRRLENPGAVMPQVLLRQCTRPIRSGKGMGTGVSNASLDRYSMCSKALDATDDIVSPDDSVSVAKGVGINDVRCKSNGAEQTLMQRIYQFWK